MCRHTLSYIHVYVMINKLPNNWPALLHPHTPVANVSLAQTLYEVDEEDGNATVCAELIGGVLEREITVYLSTEDYTAVGK